MRVVLPYILAGFEDPCIGLLVSHLFVFRLGRSKALLSSLALTVVSGVLVCVSPYPTILIITRFFLAAASSGVYLTLYVIREYFLAQCCPVQVRRGPS